MHPQQLGQSRGGLCSKLDKKWRLVTTNAVFNRFNTHIGFDPFSKEGVSKKKDTPDYTHSNAEQGPTMKKYQGFSFVKR